MKKDSLTRHIQMKLQTLQQRQKELEQTRILLCQQWNVSNDREIWHKIHELSIKLWECRGMQKVYDELQDYLKQKTPTPSSESHLTIEHVSEQPESELSQAKTMSCPTCSTVLTVTTCLDPAPQPGYITISTQYDCQHCGYHENDRVDLPKEIALQRYNLEQLLKGV
ncbi:hypothetical protein U27_01267 [Candidatus Vecturithrix granuli]|uniref:Uncharacterized protein n=1 Tax=Vecturithrix granuli TaxID=1499967 RepID=A0A081C9W2_VECG1|nr:hypothetical protein U27_01267 [Candidatus Vecturithrix granuli]